MPWKTTIMTGILLLLLAATVLFLPPTRSTMRPILPAPGPSSSLNSHAQARVSTDGWKLCRNEKYGYEFVFPGEWRIYSGQTYGADVPTGDIEVESCSVPDIIDYIIVQPTDVNRVPFQRVGVHFMDPSIYDDDMITSKETTFRRILDNRKGQPYRYYSVGGEEALFFDDTRYRSKVVVLVHKGKEIRIVFDNIPIDEVDTILSHFTFID
jgi:hypothetical protein